MEACSASVLAVENGRYHRQFATALSAPWQGCGSRFDGDTAIAQRVLARRLQIRTNARLDSIRWRRSFVATMGEVARLRMHLHVEAGSVATKSLILIGFRDFSRLRYTCRIPESKSPMGAPGSSY